MNNEKNFHETELENLKTLELEEQIENDDLLSDSDDNSNEELNNRFDINQLSNIEGKNSDNDKDELDFLKFIIIPTSFRLIQQ